MIAAALARVVSGEELSRIEMRGVIAELMDGAADERQVAALLAALQVRGESVEILIGAAEAMREKAVELPRAPEDAIDTCGTGGDGSDSFNVSTVSALVVAGAGVPVAKHGNRAATSRCGSAEVLEELGVNIELPPERMAESVLQVGIGFLYARACHPAMRYVAPIRQALGIPTLFNRLGPLTNPMRPRRQLLGVGRAEMLESTAQVLQGLGVERAWVVHGDDGLDELSTAAATQVRALAGGRVESFTLEAGAHVPRSEPGALRGGDPETNARIARDVLAGKSGAARDAVLLNAGAALCVAGRADDVDTGVREAGRAIDSGAASELLERFVAFTRGAAE